MSKPIRITEVLNYFTEPWMLDWYAKNGKAYCNRVSKAAMKVGTRVDEIIKKECVESSHIATQYKKESDEVRNALTAYRKWADVYKPKSITPCTRLYATINSHEITGEPDLMVDNVLVDIKCSWSISLKYWLQVNMYRHLEPGPYGKDNSSKVAILRLDKKTGSYEYVVKDYDPKLVDVWCGLLNAYVYLKESENGRLDVQESGEN